jgi:farnesyl-diphosphate farnesyltransferase
LKNAPDSPIDRLRGPVLHSVSRSFYLSVRLLPARLRDPITLAYLLARATDTIADTTTVNASLRTEKLRSLAGTIQGKLPREEIESLRNSFAPLQTNEAERALIEALPACLEWLDALKADDRTDLRSVLEKINQGQSLDVQRFGDATRVYALATAADLNEYTYLVAGCVGEFWTQVCFRHLRDFANRSADDMRDLGREYGKGLQLINVLRDAGTDLQNGRCYFPEEELKPLGIVATEILSKPESVELILQKWRGKAESGIAAGLEYACAIRSSRVRFATALPALIGARTLALLREAGIDSLQRTIKVTRGEIREIMASTAITLASPRALRKTFGRLSL